jgi:DNA mismatch endonuclease (patch repair protein)
MPDNLTPEQRKRAMSRVKQKNTDLEITMRSALHKRGLRFRNNVEDLPGKPDIVFRTAKVAVFIDGDFWHGYQLSKWEDKISEFWRNKIRNNRARDQKNFRKLRRMGWKVVRIWQHEIKKNPAACVDKIENLIKPMRMSI